MKYRNDIDGLRAIAVISVIAFHSGIASLSGGYIGVDVFFVISGYLITTLIHKDMERNEFTFRDFYKRRAARLLPALFVMLLMVLAFGFVFYNNKTFDNLGKEVFFSSLGAANILFAQGVNYFAKDEAYQPLIHMWSLGVEEQFYIVWPIILLITFKVSKKLVVPIAFFLFFVSLGFSINSVMENQTKGYFLLHYRAFELLVGVITALLLVKTDVEKYNGQAKEFISYVGAIMIVVPMFLLDKSSNFPGWNALWPCIGTALIIAFPNQGLITKILSYKWMVFIGLISYPLYLYHQPIVSFFHFFNLKTSPLIIFSIVTLVSMIGAWLTYEYLEKPVRKTVHSTNRKTSLVTIATLTAIIPVFVVSGLFIAKTNGFEARFKYFNPFAFEVSTSHSTTFHQGFERGFKVSSSEHSKILFVGDSVLQHYVVPMKLAFGYSVDQIDTVTRGGCVLLKGADFIDKFSDIPCNNIRDKLYKLEKKYDYVVLSQAWDSYDSSILNFANDLDGFSKWSVLLNNTVEHFSRLSDKVIIIGAHLTVNGTLSLQPSITSTRESFSENLENLKIANLGRLKEARPFFEGYNSGDDVIVIEPYQLFCSDKCNLHDGEWSYYSDSQHLSNAATEYTHIRIQEILSGISLTNKVSEH